MTLPFLASKAPPPVTPSTVTRNKSGVTTLLKRAPTGRYPVEWWLAWLKANW